MSKLIQVIILTLLIFVGLTWSTMTEESGFDGVDQYGFPWIFCYYFEGKCDDCYDDYGFTLIHLIKDIDYPHIVL